MVTKPKSNSVVTHRVEPSAAAPERITFVVNGAGSATIHLSRLSQAVRDRALLHGLIQRAADGAAKNRDNKTFKSATPEQKLAGIARIVDHLNSGTETWELAAARPDPSGDVIMAMTRAKRKDGSPFARDVEEANTIVAKWAAAKGVDRAEAIKAWLATKTIAAEVAEIQAERARAKAAESDVDAEALMAEMDEIGDESDDEPTDDAETAEEGETEAR